MVVAITMITTGIIIMMITMITVMVIAIMGIEIIIILVTRDTVSHEILKVELAANHAAGKGRP